MRTYTVELTGVQPLLMHSDNIEWADEMDAWKNDKNNKKKSKAGDDRSPAHRWIGSLYHDGKVIVIPTENIMRALMEGGAMVPVPGSKYGKTFKAQTQSGIMPTELGWPLLVNGETIQVNSIMALAKEDDFHVHQETVNSLGFSLFLKRARIGQSKHVRVRPRFEQWQATGKLVVSDDQITETALADILESAGHYRGIGDWRPGSKTPGTFGIFSARLL